MPAGGRSLILNGHIDVVSPEPSALWTGDPFSGARRRRLDVRPRRGRHEVRASPPWSAPCAGCCSLGRAARAGASSCSRWSRRSAPATARSPACSRGHPPTPRSSPSRTRRRDLDAQVGVLWFQVRGRGTRPTPARAPRAPTRSRLSGHRGAARARGRAQRSANAHVHPLWAAIEHPINLNVGVIRGGDWPSTVAGECVTHFRLALYPGEPVDELKERVEQAVAAVSAGRSFSFEVVYDGFQCEGYELPADAPLIAGLQGAAARVTGQTPPAVRLHRDDRRAHLPPLRRHAGRLLRPARGERARRRRARLPPLDDRDRAGDRAVRRGLVRRRGCSWSYTNRGADSPSDSRPAASSAASLRG